MTWARLGGEQDRLRVERLRVEAREIWQSLRGTTGRLPSDAFASLSPGLELESGEPLTLRVDSADLRPLAELVADVAPPDLSIRLGLEGRGLAAGLAAVVRDLHFDLASARVRVGVTRGHLLSIVVCIPLDIPGSDDDLQLGAEMLLEHCFGDALLDRWVESVGVTRSARTSGLMLVADRHGPQLADYQPLDDLRALVTRGVRMIQAELPECQLEISSCDWTALDVPTAAGLPQGDRVFVSTTQPEALKCALEGMPFDSARFTRGSEILVWLAWCHDLAEDRHAVRSRVEKALLSGAAFHTESPERPAWRFVGTGFGRERDFVDIWVRRDEEELGRLGHLVARAAGTPVVMSFYDSRWTAEEIHFAAQR